MTTTPGFFTSIESDIKGLFSGIAASVGSQAAEVVAHNPTVQDAVDGIQQKIDSAENAAKVAAAVAGIVVLFYYLPRFESPVPRIFRTKSSRG